MMGCWCAGAAAVFGERAAAPGMAVVVSPGVGRRDGVVVGDRRVWGMALIRFALSVGFGTLTSPWWLGKGWVHGFRASLFPAATIAAVLWFLERRDRRRAKDQRL